MPAARPAVRFDAQRVRHGRTPVTCHPIVVSRVAPHTCAGLVFPLTAQTRAARWAESAAAIVSSLIAIVGQEPVMLATLFTRVAERQWQSVELFDTVAPRLDGFAEPSRFKF